MHHLTHGNSSRFRPHHGWSIVAVLFIGFALTVGITQYSFGVFVTELEGDLGWSRSELNGALAFFAISGLIAPFVGQATDRFGSRPVMMISFFLLGIGQLLRPFMTELWHFYILTAVQYAGMPGSVMLPGAKLIGIWFGGSRGRALGLASMGANFGGAVFSTLTALLIVPIGWRSTYVIYGLLFIALIPAIWFIVHERIPEDRRSNAAVPKRVAPEVTAKQALRTRAFYLVVIALFLAQLTYLSVSTQIVPHLEGIGISRGTAAAALSLVAVFGMGGKFFFGWLTEVMPARFVLVGSLMFQTVGLSILLVGGTSGWMWIFVPIFGLGLGSLGSIMPLLIQDTFGLASFGTIFGLVNLFTLGAAIVGPVFVGASFDATGSYVVAFSVIAGLFVVAALLVSFATPPDLSRSRSNEGATTSVA